MNIEKYFKYNVSQTFFLCYAKERFGTICWWENGYRSYIFEWTKIELNSLSAQELQSLSVKTTSTVLATARENKDESQTIKPQVEVKRNVNKLLASDKPRGVGAMVFPYARTQNGWMNVTNWLTSVC